MDAAKPTSGLAADVTGSRRGIIAALIAVKGHLDQPYPDDSRWTPWTRFVEPAMGRLDESVKALVARVTDLEAALANEKALLREADEHYEAAEAQVAALTEAARIADTLELGWHKPYLDEMQKRQDAEARVAALTAELEALRSG